jgi:hypothetical protein
MHIAAATQTPCICVINGIHLGRFAPYPITAKWMHFIYPPLVQTEMDTDFKKYQNIYRYNTGHHVNEILPEMIINKLVKINIPD